MSDVAAGSVTAWEAEPSAAADDGPLAPIPVSGLRLAILGAAVAVIGLVSTQGGLAAEDATVFLNARNGFERSPLLFFYAGYASLGPDLISWALRPLPLAAQAWGYMAAAWAVGVLCGEEAFRLLRRFQPGAAALAGAVFLLWLMHNQSGLVFLNLTYLIWPALIWGALRLTRAVVEERPPGWGEITLLLAVGLSQPLAAAWAPALAWIAWKSRGVDRWRVLAALALIAAYDLANLLLAARVTAGLATPAQAWAQFLRAEGHIGARDGIVHLVTLACLAGAAAMTVDAVRARGELRRRDRALLHLLVFAALATALYLASDRFLLYRTLVERYGLAALVGGAVAALIAAEGRIPARFAAAAAGALLLLPAANLARGHLNRQVGELTERLAFLQGVDRSRAACGSEPAVRALAPADRWSLALPCRRWPQQTTAGFYRLAPDGGLAFSAEMSLESAGVYVGSPLGPRGAKTRATP